MNISKEKNLFIITLNDGKQTYYDFATGCIYGVSGKPVKDFSTQARKILKEYSENDLIAEYLYERGLTWADAKDWTPDAVETIYSLYNGKYPTSDLRWITDYCCKKEYTLDSKGVKILTSALKALENGDGKLPTYCSISELQIAIIKQLYGNLPQLIAEAFSYADDETLEVMVKDLDKILLRYEHECWDKLESFSYNAYKFIQKYISLCAELGRERTYKNFFLSICQMEKEIELTKIKASAEYQMNAGLFFEDENFITVIPTTAEEFQAEATAQGNCVFRLYYPKVLDQTTHIVFIRRKSNVNKSCITCEVSNKGGIAQYLERYNNPPTSDDAYAFRKAYQAYLKEKFNKGD